MKELEITIVNWEKHQNKRKDVEHAHWFKVKDQMWRDEKFFEFTPEEKVVWYSLLGYAAEKNSKTYVLPKKWFLTVAGISEKSLLSSLDKLSRNACVTWTLRESDALVALDIEEKREEERRGEETASADSTSLFDLWNSYAPIVRTCREITEKRKKAARSRLIENPDMAYWQEVVRRVSESAFCKGANERGWRADIDWLLRPDTHVKIMEGKYDANGSDGVNRGLQGKALYDALFREEKQ